MSIKKSVRHNTLVNEVSQIAEELETTMEEGVVGGMVIVYNKGRYNYMPFSIDKNLVDNVQLWQALFDNILKSIKEKTASIVAPPKSTTPPQ